MHFEVWTAGAQEGGNLAALLLARKMPQALSGVICSGASSLQGASICMATTVLLGVNSVLTTLTLKICLDGRGWDVT